MRLDLRHASVSGKSYKKGPHLGAFLASLGKQLLTCSLKVDTCYQLSHRIPK